MPNSRISELRVALERLRQAAEQYLDTEHRSEAREAELRSELGNAAVEATFPLYAPCFTCHGPVRETTGMVCQSCGRDYGTSDTRPYVEGEWTKRNCDGCGREVAARSNNARVLCTTCDPSDLPLQPSGDSAPKPSRGDL